MWDIFRMDRQVDRNGAEYTQQNDTPIQGFEATSLSESAT